MITKVLKVTPKAAEAIAKRAAKHIDTDKIVSEVRALIPTPKDGKDLVMTEVLRADFTRGAARLVPPGKDGQDGTPGQDGKDYQLKHADIVDIADKVRADLDNPTEEQIVAKVVDEINEKNLFVSPARLTARLNQVMQVIKSQSKGKSAGLVMTEIVAGINQVLGGDSWQSGGTVAPVDSVDGRVGAVALGDLYQAALGYTAADDSEVMHLAGAETVPGAKIFGGVDEENVFVGIQRVAGSAASVVFYEGAAPKWFLKHDPAGALRIEAVGGGAGISFSVDHATGVVSFPNGVDGIAGSTGSSVINQIAIAVDTDGNIKFAPVKIDPSTRKVSGMGVTEQDGEMYIEDNIEVIWTADGTSAGTRRGSIFFNSGADGQFLIRHAGNETSANFRPTQVKFFPDADSSSPDDGGTIMLGGVGVKKNAHIGGNTFLHTVKSGATQIAAGAAANETWKTSGHATLPDNVLMIGV